MTKLQFDMIERFRDELDPVDVWIEGDERGEELRRILDNLIAEVKKLRKEKRDG